MKLVLFHRQPAVCPDCQSKSLQRSRRKGCVEWFLHYFLFISPYRCMSCRVRHFRSRF